MNRTAKLVIIAVVALGALGVVVMKQRRSEPATENAPQTTAAAPSTAPAPVSAPVIQTAAPLPRLIDLGADKCIPCKAMAPILDELAHDFRGRFDVTFIDVWKDRTAAEPYGIRLIPTQIFLDAEGQELFRHEGFFSREDILAAWRSLGYSFGGPATQEDGW